MPATLTVENFLELVRRSGAIDPRRLDGFIGNRYGGQPPDDPNQVADDLVASGLLTRYHTEPLLAGRAQRFVLSGKYRIIDRLGSGGMASVFLCEHKVMRRRVAIKMLPPSVASNPSALDRFHREARAMAGVHHPNIVGAHDVDQDGKIHFIVMEYVEGTNFHELVRRAGPLPVERASHYIAQAARGLQHAHEKGLVHRDIKPANLLLDRSGTVKILDLGLALVFHADDDNLTKDHDANSILGTAEYLAPEQAVDSHAVDHRADIYSLGMTLYFLLAAQTPFGEGTTAQKLIWHQLRQPKPIRDHRPDVPEELWAVLSKMLTKDANERYQSMREVSDALAPWTSNPIALPSENEMPKPLDDLQSDGPTSSDSSAMPISYSGGGSAAPAFALPTPLDAGPSAAGGRSSSGGAGSGNLAASASNGVSFAIPGGLEAAIPTPPLASAPTAPSRTPYDSGSSVSPGRPGTTAAPSPSSRTSVLAAPVSAIAANPASSKSAPTSQKAVPATASPSTGSFKKKGSGSGTQKSVLASSEDEDDENDGGPKSKPKSKKLKKKISDDSEKKKKTGVLIAAGAGGIVALLGIGGLVMFASGSKDNTAVVSTAPATTTSTSPQTNKPAPVPAPKPAPTPDTTPLAPGEPYEQPRAGLVNAAVVAGVDALASKVQPDGKDPPIEAFDDSPLTKWATPAKNGWIQCVFKNGAAYRVEQYGLITANTPIDRDPKNWELYGSMTGGNDWELLDARKDQRLTERRRLYVYNVGKKQGTYKYYKLNVSRNGSNNNSTDLAEFCLYVPASDLPKTKSPDAPRLFTTADRIEAEDTVIEGGRVQNSGVASNQKKVGTIHLPNSTLTFRVDAPTPNGYRMSVSYSNEMTTATTQLVFVNGSPAGSIQYKPTGGWDKYENATIDVTLVSGVNTIQLARADGHAEIDYIAFAPIPSGTAPGSTPGPMTPINPPTAAANTDIVTPDFFPTNARSEFYEVSAFNVTGTTTRSNPWLITREKWEFKEKDVKDADRKAGKPIAEIARTTVLWGIAKTYGVMPPNARESNIPIAKLEIKEEVKDGKKEIMIGGQNLQTKKMVWEPILKIGAKKGETWTRTNDTGDKQLYTLEDFDTFEGVPSATVKTEFVQGKSKVIITYVFAKGKGEVKRTVERETTLPTGKTETKPEYLLQIKP